MIWIQIIQNQFGDPDISEDKLSLVALNPGNVLIRLQGRWRTSPPELARSTFREAGL